VGKRSAVRGACRENEEEEKGGGGTTAALRRRRGREIFSPSLKKRFADGQIWNPGREKRERGNRACMASPSGEKKGVALTLYILERGGPEGSVYEGKQEDGKKRG